jgi:Na+/H+ antiporter NhaD/arsenite permease-like protein
VEHVALPSIVCFAIPYLLASRKKIFDGLLSEQGHTGEAEGILPSSKTMLLSGLALIVFVPVFKTLTHLPPYAGMMLSFSILWVIATFIVPSGPEGHTHQSHLSPFKALSRIELPSILFFLGILLAIAAFETASSNGVSLLRGGAEAVSSVIPQQQVIAVLLGIVSAIIDNVPLVAAAMGMYTMPVDDTMWHFIAYTAGTGGSLLVVGSAAGVAAMGMEKIDFLWYLKNISLLVFLGYAAGCFVFIAMNY